MRQFSQLGRFGDSEFGQQWRHCSHFERLKIAIQLIPQGSLVLKLGVLVTRCVREEPVKILANAAGYLASAQKRNPAVN